MKLFPTLERSMGSDTWSKLLQNTVIVRKRMKKGLHQERWSELKLTLALVLYSHLKILGITVRNVLNFDLKSYHKNCLIWSPTLLDRSWCWWSVTIILKDTHFISASRHGLNLRYGSTWQTQAILLNFCKGNLEPRTRKKVCFFFSICTFLKYFLSF